MSNFRYLKKNTYDAHGNITSMPHLSTMEWDYANRLRKITCGTVNTYYCYDINGERTRKVSEKQGGIKEVRTYLGGNEVYRKYTNTTLNFERQTLHIDDDKKKVALVETKTVENYITITNPLSVIKYQYDNHLGSACLELDSSANIISYEEYHPFGTTSYRSGVSEAEVSLKRYKYVSKERDEETGLYYYGARYYAAWLCRFVSVDPLQHKYSYYTPYQYAGNKPISYIDRDGLEEDDPKGKAGALSGSASKNKNIPTNYLEGYNIGGINAPKDNVSVKTPKLDDLNKKSYSNYNSNSSNTNYTSIQADNSYLYNPDYLESNRNFQENQVIYNNFLKDAKEEYPASYTSLNSDLADGLAQDPNIQAAAGGQLLEGIVIPVVAYAAGATIKGVGLMLPSTKLGQVVRSFEGIPKLNYTFGKEVLKYTTSSKFYQYSEEGITYTTDFISKNSIETYQKLGLGFRLKNAAGYNPMSTSYNIYQTTIKGFYLSGKIAEQGVTMGGATQFAGFRILTGVSEGVQVGKAGLIFK